METKRLRVLHILGELKPSGAECMLKVAANSFDVLGIDNEILSTGSDRVGSYAPTMRAVGYVIHHIPFSKSLKFFLDFYRLVRSRRYDVVHIHSERANFWFGLVASIARVRRIVSTVHGTFAFHGWLRFRRMIFRRLQDKWGIVRVAIGRSVHDTEWKHFGSTTRIIPNWFESRRFFPTTHQQRETARTYYSLAKDEFVIVSVGNCSKIKNHSAIIQALAMLPNDFRVTYLHVGVEEAICSERELARTLGFESKVRFLGQLEDPLPVLQAADAYIMPSLSEGISIAALEAFAVGLPAILSAVSGLRDFGDYFSGIRYSEPTAASIAQAILDLGRLDACHRRNLAHEYGNVARAEFGIDIGVGLYAQLYRETLPSLRTR